MDAGQLGHAFAEKYYTRLSCSPELLHRFYGNDSIMIHGIEGRPAEKPATGQAEIKASLAREQQDQGDLQFLIRDVTSESMPEGVLVVIFGERAVNGADSQQFLQTFVLAKTAGNALYIRNDVLRVIDPGTNAITQARVQPADVTQLNGTLQDVESEVPLPTTQESGPKEPPQNPNSWAAILAQPAAPAPVPLPPKRTVAPRTEGQATTPRTPGQFSAFLKLSSSVAITKQAAAKALAPFGPLANLQLDVERKRGYVDFNDQRMFEKALNTGRVKIPGGRESIEIQKRFTSSRPKGPTNRAAGPSSRRQMKGHSGGE